MADNLRDVELLVVAAKTPDERGRAWKLRVVQWVKDDKSVSVLLEKRDFFTDDYGDVKMGKAKGLGLKDLEALRPHWTRILDLMKNPPAVAPAHVAETPAADGEVPF